MPASGGKGASKGGSSGASNAALQDDEDKMARRRVLFGNWKRKKRPNQIIDYANSPAPPVKRY